MKLSSFEKKSKGKWIIKQLKGRNGILYDLGCGDKNNPLHRYIKENLPNIKIIGVDKIKSDIVYDLNKPFPKEWKADCVVASDIISFLLSPYQFLCDCHRILKSNGIIILTTANLTYHLLRERILRIFDKSRWTPFYHSWNLAQLCNLVESAGFKVIDSRKVLDTLGVVALKGGKNESK
jgi:SAM-dependent methyltransferase